MIRHSIFCMFQEQQGLKFHVNRLLGRRCTWNVKRYFQWNGKQIFSNVVCCSCDWRFKDLSVLHYKFNSYVNTWIEHCSKFFISLFQKSANCVVSQFLSPPKVLVLRKKPYRLTYAPISACASLQSDQYIRCLQEKKMLLWLSKMRLVKTVIRLRDRAGWSDSSCDANVRLCVFWRCGSNTVDSRYLELAYLE